MKTKNITYNKHIENTVEEKEEVIDRDYYIPKLIEKLKKDKKTVLVEINGGLVTEVYNVPDGCKWDVVDCDTLKEHLDDEEFQELVQDIIDEEEKEEETVNDKIRNIFDDCYE